MDLLYLHLMSWSHNLILQGHSQHFLPGIVIIITVVYLHPVTCLTDYITFKSGSINYAVFYRYLDKCQLKTYISYFICITALERTSMTFALWFMLMSTGK